MQLSKRRRQSLVETIEPLILMSASSLEVDAPDHAAAIAVHSVSPIAIDLNHDGEIGVTGQTTAQDKTGITEIGDTVQFDIDADGAPDTIEWFDGSGDGILVDISKMQGTQISGDALFGDDGGTFANGFEKLAQLDADGNRLIESNELANLRLWVDDGDAQLESGELHKLDNYDIFSLSLRVSGDDGLMRSWAFTEDDGRIMTEDVWFAEDEAPIEQEADGNAPPVAVDDIAATESGKSIVVSVLSNDFDPDNQPLTVTSHTQAENGTVQLNANNTLTYTAPTDFAGVVYLQYTISDGVDAAIATVRIDVAPPVDTSEDVVPEPIVESDPGSDSGSAPVTSGVDGVASGSLDSSETNQSAARSSTNNVGENSEDDADDPSNKSILKAAEKAAKEAEKAAKKAAEAVEKALNEEAEAVEKAAKDAEKAAEKAARKAIKAAKNAAEAAEKAAKKALKAASK